MCIFTCVSWEQGTYMCRFTCMCVYMHVEARIQLCLSFQWCALCSLVWYSPHGQAGWKAAEFQERLSLPRVLELWVWSHINCTSRFEKMGSRDGAWVLMPVRQALYHLSCYPSLSLPFFEAWSHVAQADFQRCCTTKDSSHRDRKKSSLLPHLLLGLLWIRRAHQRQA